MKIFSAMALGTLLLLPASPAAAQPRAAESDREALPSLREVSHQGVTATVAHVRASQSDLAAYQLVNRQTGAVMRVYYDTALRRLAADHLPYLAWMIDQVARRAHVDPGQVIWHSVVFTTNADYIAPRAGNDTRWTVVATTDGRLTLNGEEMLFGVIPHEQVHAVQNSMHPGLPRWFSEGQASWIGLQISEQTRPDYVAAQRREQLETLAQIEAPLNLAAWGGLRPRREAIYRQVSREDQARMDREPNFTPSGSFRFGPGDIVADEVDQRPRYAVSLRLFQDLERDAGADAMGRWQRAIWADPGPVDTDRLAALAREHLNRNIADRLR